MVRIKLPHIYRIIPRIIWWSVFVGGAAIFLSFQYSQIPTNSQSLKLGVLKDPTSPLAHLALARQSIADGDWTGAHRELEQAQLYAPNNAEIMRQLEFVSSQEAKRADLQKEIGHWQKIVEDHPDYRDGWFTLSLLYYENYEDDKAKEALDSVFLLDPNFQPGKDFLKTLQSSLQN